MTSRRLLFAVLLLFAFALTALMPPADIANNGAEVASSGAEVALTALPAEAQATHVLIRRGGPFPYAKDGTTFFNRERLLPAQPRGHYTEYTVPTPGAADRGARRIVVGGDPRASDDLWYTDDHYRSFRRITE